jgi:uncharacterized membrane protein
MTRLLCALLLAIVAVGAAEPPPAAVTITDDGWRFAEPYQPGRRYVNRLFRFGGLAQGYGISLTLDQRQQPDGGWKTVSSYVGMPLPSQCNWYHSGFTGLSANGASMQNSEAQVEIVETGRRGMLSFTWDHPLAKVRLRLLGEPGSDHLLMEVRWTAKAGLKRLVVSFASYPQGFSPNEVSLAKGETLERHLTTALCDQRQEQTIKLTLPDEYWQLYWDATLERAPVSASGGGPAGLALVPAEVKQVTVKLGSYTVETIVELPADPELLEDAGVAHFALWDFTGKSRPAALERLREAAPVVLERMTKGSWQPYVVSEFDLARQQAELAALAQALGEPGQPAVALLRQELADLDSYHRALPTTEQPMEVELGFCRKHTMYRDIWWRAARPTRTQPRVLVLSGLFGYAWQVPELVRQHSGASAVHEGVHAWKHWVGHRVSYFPATTEELQTYDVIVLADFPQDPLTDDMRTLVRRFVRDGGGLLVLGGPHAYGAGGWPKEEPEPLLPVQLGSPFDLAPVAAPAELTLTPEGQRSLGALTGPLGVATWRHSVAPRPGAEVWLTVGDQPLVIAGQAGKGRVAAVLAAPLGETTPPAVPLWQSPGWAQLLPALLRYLASGQPPP